MSTSTSPSWRASPAAGASASGAQLLPPPGADGPPPDETVWAGPVLGFLLSLVVAIPIIFAVLMLTTFSVLRDTGGGAQDAVAAEGAAAAQTPEDADVAPVAETVAIAPAAATDAAAAAVAAALAEAEVPAQPLDQIYVVVPGDVLSKIAQRFAVTTAALAAYNELSNPNALRIGQELRIPPPGYQPPDPEADAQTDFASGPLSPQG